MYIWVDTKTLLDENIKVSWKITGLILLIFDRIFMKLLNCNESTSNYLKTLPNKIDLNFSLFRQFFIKLYNII